MANETQPLRCKYTTNPCGTDTRMVGNPCDCENCQKYLADNRLNEAKTQDGGAAFTLEEHQDLVIEATSALRQELAASNQVRDIQSALAEKYGARAEAAESAHKKTMLLLEWLTPGGSEYVGDADRCVEYIRNKIETLQDIAKNAIKAKQAAESANRELRAAIRWALGEVDDFNALARL